MRQVNSSRKKSFLRNENGATAIIYALTLLPILLLLGFAIDFSRVRTAQTHMQAAVDSATLASALDFSNSPNLTETARLDQATVTFNDTFLADVATAQGGYETVTLEVERVGENGIVGTAQGQVELAFGGLFGRTELLLEATSTAEASPPRRLEIVLALDNTTSMFRNDRFNLMRGAAKGFVNQIYDNSVGAGFTSIGVVPWATLVNINSERPGRFDTSDAADRSPDADGSREVPNPSFEDRVQYLLAPEVEENFSQTELEQAFAPVAWRGCVRSAPNERRSVGTTVINALTDAPVPGMRWHTALVEPELQSVPFSGTQIADADVINASFQLDAGRILACTQNPNGGRRNVHIDIDRACLRGNNLDLAEACVSDPNEFDYFRLGGEVCPWQQNIFPWTRARSISGPNQNCPVAMLGLSENRSQVVDKLDEMHPVTGGTHMDIGLMWGLRMLSPQSEWTNFFGQAQPGDYDDAGVRKVMILLTDGQNIAPSQIEGYYGCTEIENRATDSRGIADDCWRAPGVSTLSGGALDALTADACDAITETYGIELFTIAVDINDNRALDLLEDCAGDPERAFNIRASELESVFEAIASQELRLLQ